MWKVMRPGYLLQLMISLEMPINAFWPPMASLHFMRIVKCPNYHAATASSHDRLITLAN